MRLFLVLCCTLVAIANGKPQGYNYGTGISGGNAQGGSYHSGGSSFGGGLSGLGGLSGGGSGFGSFGSASNSGPSFGGFHGSSSGGSRGGFSSGGSIGHGAGGFGSGIGGGNFGVGSGGFGSGVGGGFNAGAGGFGGYNGQQQTGAFEAPFVHKQFITVSAPEDHELLEKTKHFVIGRPQKNYRVVFIKAPSSSSANVKLSAEYAPQEEKTVIYVLSKKDSSLEVNDIATPAPTVPAKPEVFFIKYKTEEEAHHAQQQIQAEYDRIDGTSEHTDAGIGQQQSVVGILDGGAGGNGGAGIGGGVGIGGGNFVGASSSNFGVSHSSSSGAKSSTYLPPAKAV